LTGLPIMRQNKAKQWIFSKTNGPQMFGLFGQGVNDNLSTESAALPALQRFI